MTLLQRLRGFLRRLSSPLPANKISNSPARDGGFTECRFIRSVGGGPRFEDGKLTGYFWDGIACVRPGGCICGGGFPEMARESGIDVATGLSVPWEGLPPTDVPVADKPSAEKGGDAGPRGSD